MRPTAAQVRSKSFAEIHCLTAADFVLDQEDADSFATMIVHLGIAPGVPAPIAGEDFRTVRATDPDPASFRPFPARPVGDA